MTSKKQIEANRKNAKKSTGPKTEAGKAVSSGNAFKHGLTSRRVWLEDEDEEQFRDMRIEIMNELRPHGTLETLLAVRVASQLWRLSRVPGIEAELFDRLRRDVLGNDEGLAGAWLRDGAPYEGVLGRLTRYEGAIERSITRIINELRQLQADRLKRDAREEAEEAEEAVEAQWRDIGPDGSPMDLAVSKRVRGDALEPNERSKKPGRDKSGQSAGSAGSAKSHGARKLTGRPGWDGAGRPEPKGKLIRGKGGKGRDGSGGGPGCKPRRRNEPIPS
ncbi:MAG: hypothetical protein V3S64_13140 [bacterium]